MAAAGSALFVGAEFAYLGIALGLVSIVIGAGLILRVELIRGIVNVCCWFKIGIGFFSLVSMILASGFFGPAGILIVLIQLIDISWTGLQIWVIAETDTMVMD